MKISFYGAARMVTGSCFLVQTEEHKFLVDCGLFQGGSEVEQMNDDPFPFDPEELDFVVLTHAHIDHSGRIPKLFKEGFRNKIYTNKATVELCDIMLQDSAHIQEMEMEWKNKKRERKGLPLLEPRYTMEDAIGSISLFEGIEYGKTIYFGGTLEITLINSGHMLGSSFVLIRVYEKDRWNRYLFTGDMGNTNMPLIKDPAYIDEIDYLIIESTYGNRVHETKMEEDKLLEIILKTARKGGNVVIPSFAVGRTQEVLYEINRYKENNMLEEHDDIPVYVDSPLAIKATEVFKQNCKILNKATKRLIEQGDDPLLFKNLHFSLTTEQSKQINRDETPKVIISASGMLDGGRVKHHLKHNLWKDNSALVFVGYQAPGTLGHRILNYREFGDEVRILGESIKIRNEIYQVEGFSAHGDKILLLDWIDKVKNDPLKIILVHGEVESMESMKKDIEKRFTSEVLMPDLGDTIETTYEEEVIEHEKLIEFEGADKEAVIEHLLDLMETIETKESISYDKTMDKIEEIKTLLSNRKK